MAEPPFPALRDPGAAEARGAASRCWGEFSPALKVQETRQGPTGALSAPPPVPPGLGTLSGRFAPRLTRPLPRDDVGLALRSHATCTALGIASGRFFP